MTKRTPVRCDQTGQEFPSIKQAADQLGLSYASIFYHLKGDPNRKQVGGFTFTKLDVTAAPPETERRPPTGASTPRRIRCDQTGVEFPSVNKAAKEMGLFGSNLSRHINGDPKHSHVGNYTFTLLTDDS